MKTLFAILIALVSTALCAQERLDASSLERAAIYGRALAQVERGLSANPDAPQLRLLKGHFLAELGRTREAIETLQKLAADHPELAEPRLALARLNAVSAGETGRL